MNWFKLFKISIVLLFVEVIAIACISKEIIHIKDVAAADDDARAQPMIIYIDEEFNSEEKEDIQKAMNAWEAVSDNKFKFIPVWYSPMPGRYHQLQLKSDQGFFFWKINKDGEHFNKELREKHKHHNGLFVPGPGNNSAHILLFAENITREHFYRVTLHELGHFLGLHHTDESTLAIMATSVVGKCITNYDTKPLCEIYGCEPKPECVIRKVSIQVTE